MPSGLYRGGDGAMKAEWVRARWFGETGPIGSFGERCLRALANAQL